jgi:hypothetical protein
MVFRCLRAPAGGFEFMCVQGLLVTVVSLEGPLEQAPGVKVLMGTGRVGVVPRSIFDEHPDCWERVSGLPAAKEDPQRRPM